MTVTSNTNKRLRECKKSQTRPKQHRTIKQKILPARALVANCLVKIIQQQHSFQQCHDLIEHHPEKSFIQALIFEVIRNATRLQSIANRLLNKPIKKKYADVECLLWIGLNEIQQAQTPDYASINEINNAAKALNKSWACALLNKLCREFARNPSKYIEASQKISPLPEWWQALWQQDWPEQFAEIVQASLSHPPMICRVNTNKISREDYCRKLDEAKIPAAIMTAAPQAIVLQKPCQVTCLPGFEQGEVCVQDSCAQLAVPLLDIQASDHCLDACSAPGGKTTHFFECQPQLRALTAVDKSEKRLGKVKEVAEKFQYPVNCLAADICDTDTWWDGIPFDKILCDAPCSGSGVIRRHPDILYCRDDEMITDLTHTQRNILHALWATLKPGGKLLYVTCSILKKENEAVIQAFLTQQSNAHAIDITLPFGQAQQPGWQCLPGEGGDGFYFCLLGKEGNG